MNHEKKSIKILAKWRNFAKSELFITIIELLSDWPLVGLCWNQPNLILLPCVTPSVEGDWDQGSVTRLGDLLYFE